MGQGSSARSAPPAARGTLRRRLEGALREVLKFGAVGGAGVLVNLLVFNLVRHTTDLQVVRASIVATVVSIVFNYVGFRHFTYRDRD
ncbi:GtrA family protein, partial [Streptomyces sp. TRM76130]|nr:GtrA family protein [Streptomyces sp. TRM76130]